MNENDGAATTGHCLSRQLYHGTGQDRPFTDAEKIADAMETAQRHMAMIEAVSDDMQANAKAETRRQTPPERNA